MAKHRAFGAAALIMAAPVLAQPAESGTASVTQSLAKTSLIAAQPALSSGVKAPFAQRHLVSDLPRDVEVLGEVHAQMNGASRTWLTFLILETANTARQATARWERFDTSLIPGQQDAAEMFGIDPDTLNEQERAYLEAMTAQLADRQDAVLQALSEELIWSVQAHDPDNPALLTEGVLSIMPLGMGRNLEEWNEQLGLPLAASISYTRHSDGGLPGALYVSDYDDDGDGRVILDALTLEGEFGHIAGQFSGTLCLVTMAMGRIDVDSGDCREISGTFDTELLAVSP